MVQFTKSEVPALRPWVFKHHCVTLILCSGSKTNKEMAVIDWFYIKTLNVNDLWYPLVYSGLLGAVSKIDTYMAIQSPLKNLTVISNWLPTERVISLRSAALCLAIIYVAWPKVVHKRAFKIIKFDHKLCWGIQKNLKHYWNIASVIILTINRCSGF